MTEVGHSKPPRRRLRLLIVRHRRKAAAQVLAGAFYGLGSGAVGLLVFWLKRHL